MSPDSPPDNLRACDDRQQRHSAGVRARRSRSGVASSARASVAALHALVPVRRREHGLVDGRRVLRLRDRGRRERRGARGLRLPHRLLRHEHEREARRGDLHLARICRLVALDGLDLELALESPVGLELPAHRLPAPGDVPLVANGGRDEVPVALRVSRYSIVQWPLATLTSLGFAQGCRSAGQTLHPQWIWSQCSR